MQSGGGLFMSQPTARQTNGKPPCTFIDCRIRRLYVSCSQAKAKAKAQIWNINAFIPPCLRPWCICPYDDCRYLLSAW